MNGCVPAFALIKRHRSTRNGLLSMLSKERRKNLANHELSFQSFDCVPWGE